MREGDKECHNTVTLQVRERFERVDRTHYDRCHLTLLFLFKAGLRTLHEAGPELKRAISGNLEELMDDNPEPTHRVRCHCLINDYATTITRHVANENAEKFLIRSFFFFQRNHSLFGSVWSSMRKGHHSFHRARSLKVNSKVKNRVDTCTIYLNVGRSNRQFSFCFLIIFFVFFFFLFFFHS